MDKSTLIEKLKNWMKKVKLYSAPEAIENVLSPKKLLDDAIDFISIWNEKQLMRLGGEFLKHGVVKEMSAAESQILNAIAPYTGPGACAVDLRALSVAGLPFLWRESFTPSDFRV